MYSFCSSFSFAFSADFSGWLCAGETLISPVISKLDLILGVHHKDSSLLLLNYCVDQ